MLKPTDYDNPWKEALARYLAAFLELCLPEAYRDIDWSRGYQLLDQELRQITRRSTAGPRRVDLLVQVWRRDGSEAWVLLHVEVQAQVDAGFAKRMWRYYTRIMDRYDRPVASIAVLADDNHEWRPASYSTALWGCRSSLEFPVVKLLDLNEADLAASRNPLAVVIRAHRRAQATRRSPARRLRSKMELVQDLYRAGLSREDTLELLRLLDWLLTLPDELEETFWDQLQTWEEENQMPYITSWERRGRREALHELILENLALKLGNLPEDLVSRVHEVADQARLRALVRASMTANSLESFRRQMDDAH